MLNNFTSGCYQVIDKLVNPDVVSINDNNQRKQESMYQDQGIGCKAAKLLRNLNRTGPLSISYELFCFAKLAFFDNRKYEILLRANSGK